MENVLRNLLKKVTETYKEINSLKIKEGGININLENVIDESFSEAISILKKEIREIDVELNELDKIEDIEEIEEEDKIIEINKDKGEEDGIDDIDEAISDDIDNKEDDDEDEEEVLIDYELLNSINNNLIDREWKL